MIQISKEDSERLVEMFLIETCKDNVTKEFAEESMGILNDPIYKTVLLSSLLIDFKDKFKDEDEGEHDMRVSMFACANSVFDEDCDEEDLPLKFKDLFSKDPDVAWYNPKLQFAFDQFVSAFYLYELFEEKYPKITKQLEDEGKRI